MENVQFDEKRIQINRPSPKGMADWLVTKKVADSRLQANLLLIATAVCLLLLAWLIWDSNQPEPIDYSAEIRSADLTAGQP